MVLGVVSNEAMAANLLDANSRAHPRKRDDDQDAQIETPPKRSRTSLQKAVDRGEVPKARRPFCLFCSDRYHAQPAESKVAFNVLTKSLAFQWRSMTDEEKKPWTTRSADEFKNQREHSAANGITLRRSQVKTDEKDVPEGQQSPCQSEEGFRGMRLASYYIPEVASSIGFGSFGQVFKAVNLATGQKCAIKLFGANGESSMKREVETYNLLHDLKKVQAVQTVKPELNPSSFFVQVMGSSNLPTPWICMQDGGPSVKALIDRDQWKDTWLFPAACQIRQALIHMHFCGLAHLDVKPSNIVLDPELMNFRLIDMGLAELWTDGGSGLPLPPLKYVTYCTEPYRPPELFRHDVAREHLPFADWQPC